MISSISVNKIWVGTATCSKTGSYTAIGYVDTTITINPSVSWSYYIGFCQDSDGKRAIDNTGCYVVYNIVGIDYGVYKLKPSALILTDYYTTVTKTGTNITFYSNGQNETTELGSYTFATGTWQFIFWS